MDIFCFFDFGYVAYIIVLFIICFADFAVCLFPLGLHAVQTDYCADILTCWGWFVGSVVS